MKHLKIKIMSIALLAAATSSMAQSLDKMNWLNEPQQWEIKEGKALVMDVPAKTDFWRISHYGFTVDDGPFYYATITQMERGEVETLSLSEEHRNILSEREKEILRCIRKGLSSKEIAATLYISVNTVNRHRQNILEKLSVGNSIEACRAAELMKLL